MNTWITQRTFSCMPGAPNSRQGAKMRIYFTLSAQRPTARYNGRALGTFPYPSLHREATKMILLRNKPTHKASWRPWDLNFSVKCYLTGICLAFSLSFVLIAPFYGLQYLSGRYWVGMYTNKYVNRVAVFRIRDILVPIRIRGSVPLTKEVTKE